MSWKRPIVLLKVLIACTVIYGIVLVTVGRGLFGLELSALGFIVKYNDDQQMAVEQIRQLIEKGLVIPRWSDEPETPAVEGAPGK